MSAKNSVFSKPERAGLLEYRHELAGDVHGHEPVEPAEEPAPDEHRRERDVATAVGDEARELRLGGDLVHGGVDAQPLQQPLHDVAEAAAAPPDDEHRALRHRPPHLLPALLPRRRWQCLLGDGHLGGHLISHRQRRLRPRRPRPAHGAVRDGLVHSRAARLVRFFASAGRELRRRGKYGHSYQGRAHRTSCSECDLDDHNAGSYRTCEFSSGDKAGVGHSYQYQNGEEFSATSGCEQVYHKKDHEVTPSTASQDRPLIPSTSAVMCDCRDCYMEQESSPSSTEHARTRSNLQAPLHRRLVKPSHEHRSFAPDEHSAFEVEYTVRESRGRYVSSRDALSSHSRKHHRPAR